jgi:HAE1 family hydrophobic/amphiphilic exporter-1
MAWPTDLGVRFLTASYVKASALKQFVFTETIRVHHLGRSPHHPNILHDQERPTMFNAITQWVLSRRSATILIASLVFVIGLYGTTQLQEELLPNFSFPYLVVTAVDPGASSQVVADQVSQPIEAAASQLSGVQQINSTSLQGFSVVLVQFNFGVNTDTLQQQLNTKIAAAQLPTSATGATVQTTITQLNANTAPILYVTVEGKNGQTSAQLAQWADQTASPALSTVSDIGNVQVVGDTTQQMIIALNSSALTAHGLSVSDITTSLRSQGISFPAGTADIAGQLVPVRVATTLPNAQSLGDLLIASPTGGKPVRLADVATLSNAQVYPNGSAQVNGTSGVLLNIYKSQAGNTVKASDGVLSAITKLNHDNPDYHLTPIYDQAQQIRDSINGVVREGILGAILAIVVIFLFLRSLRSTLVTGISIPLSIVTALALLWWQGISLNTLTLGALAIAVGRVVDDAIVVLENIYRHAQAGEPIRDAVRSGTREVATAITTSTITTVCVFLPLGFTGGIVGQLFLPFALTVTFALLASLVVALTIVPVFASFFIKVPTVPTANGTRAVLVAPENTVLQRAYTPILRWGLRHRWGTLGIAFGLLLLTFAGAGAANIPVGFLPSGNATLLQGTLAVPQGADPRLTTGAIQGMEGVLATYKSQGKVALYEITTTGNSALDLTRQALGGGNTTATLLITLPAHVDGAMIAKDLQRDLQPAAPPGGTIAVSVASSFGMGGNTLSYVVNGPNAAAVKIGSDAVLNALQPLKNIAHLKSDVSSVTPQIVVIPDPTKNPLANSALIGQELSALLQGQSTGTLTFGDGSQAQILVAVPGLGSGDITGYIAQIQQLPLAPGITVGDVATVQQIAGVTQVTRINQSLAATITADITTDNTGQVTQDAANALNGLSLPAGVTVTQAGIGQQQAQAFGGLAIAILAAIALVYLVMVIAFGSLREPFAILFSLPLAFIGGIAALIITHHQLNLSSIMGFLMLIGIVVTNAVVLVDLYNQLHAKGMTTEAALIEAGRTRVRPILMTALATILALMPLALGLGGNEGSIIASDLGVVVIGGLLTSTLLTLVVVPVVVSLLDRHKAGTAPAKQVMDDGSTPPLSTSMPRGS